MADDEFFDNDEDFLGFEDDDSSSDDENSDGTRSLAEFNAEVDRRIAILRSVKQPVKTRIAAANWLGECGDTRAIKALVQVYRSKKSSRGLRAAAKRALGHFKALDAAIERDEGEGVENALEREENAWVIERLTEIAYNSRPPASRGRWLLLTNGVLAVLLALLFVIYQVVPTDAVKISDIVENLGGGAGEALPTTPPLPTATIDPLATPLPTDLPPTPTPEPTATPLPTATPVSGEHIRMQLREMYDILSRVDTQRGILDQLNINWTTLQTDPSTGPRLCASTDPTIPDDIVLAEGFNEREPSIKLAADQMNSGLAILRQGWTYWRTGCTAGDVASRINTGLQTVLVVRDNFNMARTFLDLVPR